MLQSNRHLELKIQIDQKCIYYIMIIEKLHFKIFFYLQGASLMFKIPHFIFGFSLALLSSMSIAVNTKAVSLTEHINNSLVSADFGPKQEEPAPDQNQQLSFLEQINKQLDSKIQTLSDREILTLSGKLVSENSQFTTNIIDSSIINKIALVNGGEQAHTHLLGTIFNGHLSTAIGKAYTANTFGHPINDVKILRNRQQAISLLSANQTAIDSLDACLQQISTTEKKSLFFWDSKSPVSQELLKPFYYGSMIDYNGMLKKLNTSTTALEVGILQNHLGLGTILLAYASPILIPAYGVYHIAKKENCSYSKSAKIVASASKLLLVEAKNGFLNLSIGGKIGTLYTSLVIAFIPYLMTVAAKNQADMLNHLQNIMISTATHINALKKLSEIINEDEALLTYLPSLEPLAQITNDTMLSAKLNKLLGMLDTNTFKGEPSFFSVSGRVLAAYELMKQVKDELAPAVVAAGELDMYVALAKIYNSRKNNDVRYCMAQFIENQYPRICAQGFWNPFISPDNVVLNNATFDLSNPNSILTGPNTGGKSTVIKSIFIDVLMAQTFGMAAAQSLTLTPFATLDCFMNISDDIAIGASLFKAEVMRAKKILDMVQSLGQGEFSFIIIDEIFTGTSPQEGEIAACKFAKQLGESINNISIIATHYPKMIDLETQTNGRYRNHHVEILRNEDGSLNRTFKFKQGPSYMNVAFDILKEEGVLI